MQLAVDKALKEPGSSISRVFRPKPAELAFEGIAFSKKPIQVAVDLQNVGGGIIGSIEVRCELTFACARCVEQSPYLVSAARQIQYLVNPTPEALEAELDGWFVSQYDGRTIVFDDDVRQMLLLALPMQLVCREECRGLCPHCGANLNHGSCACPQTPSRKTVSPDSPFRAAFDNLRRKKKL